MPSHADTWPRLEARRRLLSAAGRALERDGQLEAAEPVLREAVALDPHHAAVWQRLGNVLGRRGNAADAADAFAAALEVGDYPVGAYRAVARAYASLNEERRAREVIEQLLDRWPDDSIGLHLAGAVRPGAPPRRASNACLRAEFDGFAANFDKIMGELDYIAPQLVDAAVHDVLGHRRLRSIADLGCGTGLLGELLRPRADHLVGVDISAAMLAKADGRGCYDELVEQELTEFLSERPASVELISAADCFIYFGPLEEVFASARAALTAHGFLVFSVEAGSDDGPDHRLTTSGRYTHQRTYLERALAAAGFEQVSIEPAVIRTESGRPVDGLVVTARKSAESGTSVHSTSE